MKLKLSITLCSSLSLISCANTLVTKEIIWERKEQVSLNEICNRHNHYKTGVYGCAVWKESKLDKRCYVYTLDTLKEYSPAEQYVLGHEIMHCFKGQFHSQ